MNQALSLYPIAYCVFLEINQIRLSHARLMYSLQGDVDKIHSWIVLAEWKVSLYVW